jgi:Zn-dependent M28 family amino/carboxypeptidase
METQTHYHVLRLGGEEEGLLGSTEWVEEHAAELQQKAVVYINSDVMAAVSSKRRAHMHSRVL